MNGSERIRPRERDAIVQSLRAGVVPPSGHRHIQVGRVEETKAVLRDIERLADGGSGIRFVIGPYGSGKSFFLQLLRSIALEKKLVTLHADLNPERRLYASGGQARSLYAELSRNVATRASPDGGALGSVVERFITTALSEARARGTPPIVVIHERLGNLSEMVGGYDFAEVVGAYWRGHDTGNEVLKSAAVRWLRGEYATKTDARTALGVRTIVDDTNVYDFLKLMARFMRLAGFSGLLVCLDEMVNLYKLANTKARLGNYEQILRIVNDTLQGTAEGLGFLLAGTPEFLMDTRKGLYSYPALQSRLAENAFAVDGLVDYNHPILRLGNLSPEDLFVVLAKVRHVYATGDPSQYLLPDDGVHAFMLHCSQRVGEAYFRTPRTTITAFVNLLAVLEQNPGVSWQEILKSVEIQPETNPDLAPLPDDSAEEDGSGEVRPGSPGDDELSNFRL